jgi:hypothetical protein
MMGKPGTSYVIEIATGIGEPASIPLFRGQELSPISVGRKGMWRVESARTLDVHAFLYFDGNALFMQSADEAKPAVVDGKCIGKTWTELRVSCTIELGSVRLRYRALAGEGNIDTSVPMPPQAPAPPAARATPETPKPERPATRPFARGAFAPMTDFEATRVRPLEAESREQKPPARRFGSPRPAAGRPVSEAPAVENHVELQTTRVILQSGSGGQSGGTHSGSAPVDPTEQESTVILSPLANVPTRIAPPLPANPRPAPVPMGAVPTYGPNPEYPYPYSPTANAFAETRLGAPLPPLNTPSGAGSMDSSVPYHGSFPTQTPTARAQSKSKPGSSTGLVAKWKAQIPSPRVLALFFVVVALGIYVVFFDDDKPSPKPAKTTQANTSASAPVVPPSALVAPARVTDADASPAQQEDASSAPALSTAALPAQQDASAPANPVYASDAGTPAADGGKGKGIDTTTSASSKTLERQAVDAYASGDFALAAQRYAELAKSDPSNPAYEQAARIARMRLDAGLHPVK